MDKHAATERKRKQLEDAEKEHDKAVQEEEEEEAKEQQEKEEKLEAERQKKKDADMQKEHEELLKSLSQNANIKAASLDDLQEFTEQ